MSLPGKSAGEMMEILPERDKAQQSKTENRHRRSAQDRHKEDGNASPPRFNPLMREQRRGLGTQPTPERVSDCRQNKETGDRYRSGRDQRLSRLELAVDIAVLIEDSDLGVAPRIEADRHSERAVGVMQADDSAVFAIVTDFDFRF